MIRLPLLCPLLALATATAAPLQVDADNFTLVFTDGHTVARGQMQETGTAGAQVRQFADPHHGFTVALAHASRRAAEVEYTRTFVTVTNTGTGDLPLAGIVMADAPVPASAHVAGNVNGSPIVSAATFFGVEHPFAQNGVAAGRAHCALPVMQPLRPGEQAEASFVCGTAREASQLRRAFLDYVERERPRPYAPFLHHNTWYNLGYGKPFSEADELALIAKVGRELVTRRHVRLDGFVLDDGWDDTRSLWRFHAGWPHGLVAMQKAAARFGAAPGIWLSPWGGYEEAKAARLAAAAPEGFEIRDGSFSLAGPRYYQRFRDLCASVVRDNGVVFFKFDGIGAHAIGTIDAAAGRDFDAMLRLVAELRRLQPKLYVSQTTGTWASPWWLLHVDNIWRGGDDHAFTGVGTSRQQWITYRDAQTFKNVVQRSPLFPLNSVMIHGILYSRQAERLATDPGDDFRSEVRSYFGSGTQLQELYLSPELLTDANWDDLAAAARWSRDNTPTLRDTHWIGGDPAQLQVYGWAAWSGQKGIITLRNPSDRPAQFALEAGAAFELPTGAPRDYRVSSPYPDQSLPCTTLAAGAPATIQLRPFQVLVLEAAPTS